MSLFKKAPQGPRSYTEIEAVVGQRIVDLIAAERDADVHELLRQSGLTMADIQVMTDTGLVTRREPETGSPTPEAVEEPVGEPESEGLFVTLPDGIDMSDPHMRAKVEERVKASYGSTFIPLWPLGVDPLDGVDPRVPLLDTRPGAQTVTLPEGVKPTDGHRVAEAGKNRGLGDIVDFDPYGHTATFAHLTAPTRQFREAVARELNVRDIWDLELLVGPDMVIVLNSPSLSNDEKRVERWQQLARTLLPANAGEKWLVEDDASTRRIYLRRVVDRLRQVAPYDWDAPVDMHRIPFGIREDGSPFSLGLLEVNALLGGTPGSGKSGGATALLCGIARLENTALIGLDPKRVELSLWADRFTRIAKDEDGATDVLERLQAEMERRYVWLEENGLKKFGPAQFSPEQPLLVVLIDELADLVSIGATPEEKKAEAIRSTMIRRLIAKGRAAGIVLITATQKPQSDVIPTALRDLIQMRVGFATTNPAMTETILGAGMAQTGGECHTISAKERGVCYVVSESSRTPIRARAYWVPDEDVADIAKRDAHLRIDLPWLTDDSESLKPGEIIRDHRRPPKPAAVEVLNADDLLAPAVEDLGSLEFSLDDLEEF